VLYDIFESLFKRSNQLQVVGIVGMLEHKILGQTLCLFPEKAIFWKEMQTLILADLHLGKAGHFRKSGIPISDLVHNKDILILDRLIEKSAPKEVIFLGDLFHSDHNSGWEVFRRWVKSKAPLKFKLVLGNHDILDQQLYYIANLEVVEKLDLEPFTLTHIPEETELYNLAGHIHPAIKLSGKGRQSLRVPCFYFGERNAVLPAFGNFTGTGLIKVTKSDSIYGITEEEVIKFN